MISRSVMKLSVIITSASKISVDHSRVTGCNVIITAKSQRDCHCSVMKLSVIATEAWKITLIRVYPVVATHFLDYCCFLG